jgi:hypothetical protein
VIASSSRTRPANSRQPWHDDFTTAKISSSFGRGTASCGIDLSLCSRANELDFNLSSAIGSMGVDVDVVVRSGDDRRCSGMKSHREPLSKHYVLTPIRFSSSGTCLLSIKL